MKKQTVSDRFMLCVVLVMATLVLTVSVRWISLASPAQLAQTSRAIFVGCGVLAIFMAGAVVGGILGRPRTDGAVGGGNDEPGEPPPPAPYPEFDCVEEELQRLIDEDQSTLH